MLKVGIMIIWSKVTITIWVDVLIFPFIFIWFSEYCFEVIQVFQPSKQSKQGIGKHSLMINMHMILKKMQVFVDSKFWKKVNVDAQSRHQDNLVKNDHWLI